MSRRELVARTLYEAMFVDAYGFTSGIERAMARQQADAVLAALEPWLLPEPADQLMAVTVSRNHTGTVLSDTRWIASVWYGVMGPDAKGLGPTIPAAIRAALEGGDR